MEIILKQKNYTYIQCQGAHQFITDYLRILETINRLEPNLDSGPSIIELKNAFASSDSIKAPLYIDYLENKISELKRGLPDFKKFSEYDDAIVEQINNGKSISYSFIEAVLLACKYGDKDSIYTIYDFFGNFINLRESQKNPEGYAFLIYEFFVAFIAGLIKFNQWDVIGEILNKELFAEENYEKYIPFTYLSYYIRVLDETRNRRLNGNRISIMADMLHDRFTNTELSKLITHKQFMEADYFLFIKSICDDKLFSEHWWGPRSCVYLDKTPNFMDMAQNQMFLNKLSNSVGFQDSSQFLKRLGSRNSEFTNYFSNAPFKRNPLRSVDFSKLGSRK